MKQKISIASNQLKPKDMSRSHYTTLGFGSIFPIFVEEVVPRDKVNLKVHNFSRLSAMYLPNLGTLTLKLHSFYVPFRLVWNHFDNFKEGLPSWNSNGAQVYKNVPKVDDQFFTDMFTDSAQATWTSAKLCTYVGSSSSVQGGFDFMVYFNYNGTKTPYYFKFTKIGKQIYHVLNALGYNFNFVDMTDNYYSADLNAQYSLLPLLCWFKVYLDYYIPSQFQPSSYINQLFSYLHEQTATTISSPISTAQLPLLVDCFTQCLNYYQNNYFSSAWQTPSAVVSGLNNIGTQSYDKPQINSVYAQGSTSLTGQFSRQQLDNDPSGVARTNFPISTVNTNNVNTVNSTNRLSADGLTFLQKFARYCKRSNFAGSRVVERILARYGVRVDDFQIGMSKYLGSQSIDLQKCDVTNTGDNTELGDYAGKGWFTTQGQQMRTFKCDCDYFGMVFVCASIETPSTPLTGCRRRNFHLNPLDFWTPELDGGTMQAISGNEVLAGQKIINTNTDNAMNSFGFYRGHAFGFSPRYSCYKMALDDICGDFRIPRLASNIDPFILPRRIYDEIDFYENIALGNDSDPISDYMYDERLKAPGHGVLTPSDLLFGNDMYQFNRIFRDTDGFADPIFSVFKIDCVINSPTLPLNESSELIGRGKVHEFETNGVHL